jgi:hypothetical protein
MTLAHSTIGQLVESCAKSEDIADIRASARADFFGYYEPEPVNYVADTGDISSCERRFLGWFAFNFKLPDGRHPAELAANVLLKEPKLGSALRAIQNTRYVTAVATRVIYGRGFHLELEDEEFAINGTVLSHILRRGQAVSAHILPTSRSRWLLAPGWLAWPILPGPGLRSRLKSVFQPDPIEVERFLQGRVKVPEELKKIEYPGDDTLEAAVARMSGAAEKEGKPKLIMSPEEWKSIVLSHMMSNDSSRFAEEIYQRAENFDSIEEANKWLALAMNIWNNTPQPDRGGKSANQLIRQQGGNSKKSFTPDGW